MSIKRHIRHIPNHNPIPYLVRCLNVDASPLLSFFRQILPAVVRALKTRPARLALCQELEHHVTAVTNKAMLEPLQVQFNFGLRNFMGLKIFPVD